MGVGYNFVCLDCKKYYQLGYGSYGTWLYANSIADYEKLPPLYKDYGKNANLEKCLREHDGHDISVLNMDNTYERGDKLFDENNSPYNYQPDTLITDLAGFERIDLTKGA